MPIELLKNCQARKINPDTARLLTDMCAADCDKCDKRISAFLDNGYCPTSFPDIEGLECIRYYASLV